jgi:dipeptidyl aminopeptidase
MPQQYDPLSQEDDSPIRDVELDDVDSLHAGLLPRPAVYYGDGPFNAPSSDEEDESEVAEKDGPGSLNRAEHGHLLGLDSTDDSLHVGGRRQVCYMPSARVDMVRNGALQEFPSVRGLLIALAALLTLSGVIGLFAALSYKETKRAVPGNERITLDHIFNGTFGVARTGLSWVSEGMPNVCHLL